MCVCVCGVCVCVCVCIRVCVYLLDYCDVPDTDVPMESTTFDDSLEEDTMNLMGISAKDVSVIYIYIYIRFDLAMYAWNALTSKFITFSNAKMAVLIIILIEI